MPLGNALAQTSIKIDPGSHSTVVERGGKRTIAWNDMIDRIVDVDGLAWGAFHKGLGSHLVLPHGKVYLSNTDLLKSDLNGRLVRVTGILRKSHVSAAPTDTIFLALLLSLVVCGPARTALLSAGCQADSR